MVTQDDTTMSISLDYSVMSGDGRSCSLRTTVGQMRASCPVEMASLTDIVLPDSYQLSGFSLRCPSGLHLRLWTPGLLYHPQPLSTEPGCGVVRGVPPVRPVNVLQERFLIHGTATSPRLRGAALGQLHCAHATYGGGHEQANLRPFNGCSNPLSSLHAAHLDACCSPLSERASNSQTFDRMKAKRNPPKTGECHAEGDRCLQCSSRTNITISITALEKELIFNKYLTWDRCVEIATAFQLNETQVKMWFQNCRMKQKKCEKEGLLPNKPLSDNAESEKSLSAPSTSSPASSTVSSGS
uniref:Homeobox A1a n=1 Tax=Salmo trutta TaxID=8032 RepID=A0A673ZF92_SALTR